MNIAKMPWNQSVRRWLFLRAGFNAKGAREMTGSHRFSRAGIRGALVLATVAVAGCTAASSSSDSLQQVEASNPSVTYEYAGDDELLEAQQEAVVFCSQYGSSPRPARLTSGASGGANSVVFECDPNLPVTAPPVVRDSDLAYSYTSDQELLAAWRNAHSYCRDNGWEQATSNIRTNTDGSRTVVFQCA